MLSLLSSNESQVTLAKATNEASRLNLFELASIIRPVEASLILIIQYGNKPLIIRVRSFRNGETKGIPHSRI